MSHETYLDDSESREWILETHAKALPDAWKSLIRRSCSAVILYGNDDCPYRIEFYGTNSPMSGETPMISLGPDQHGNLTAMMLRLED
jgi:hypothetical protein